MTEPTYLYYGTMATAGELTDFLDHLLETNRRAEAEGRPKTPICIWGRHGIGKTQIVRDTATRLDHRFAYIAPAQFEEMGDLVGMPAVEDGRTVWRPPTWVPTEEGPGILLIDDVNRADDRILRGLMQLLQNYELVSWSLPPGWQIVCTANPDGGDYSVTPMDDAMLTRMMHISLRFDARDWARWAIEAGVDARGIDFVLLYPEIVTGRRTTPRSLVQFFEALRRIQNLKADLALVRLLGASCLDEETVGAFISHVRQGLSELVRPEQILGAGDFEREIVLPLRKAAGEGPELRVDILAAVCTRFVLHLGRQRKKLDTTERENLLRFVKLEMLPPDMRLALARDLSRSKNPHLKVLLGDPEVARLLLDHG